MKVVFFFCLFLKLLHTVTTWAAFECWEHSQATFQPSRIHQEVSLHHSGEEVKDTQCESAANKTISYHWNGNQKTRCCYHQITLSNSASNSNILQIWQYKSMSCKKKSSVKWLNCSCSKMLLQKFVQEELHVFLHSSYRFFCWGS